MSNPTKGVVYVATRREHYAAEAFLSAHSIKEFEPDLPITLYTDVLDSPLVDGDCFDQVIPIDTVRTYTSLWSEGQLDRITCLIGSPYDYTLHLDVDTRVLSPEFITLFDRLETIDIGMAICQPDVSNCSEWSGFPMFNVGCILFRKNKKTEELLTNWRDLTRKHFDAANMETLPDVEYLRHVDDPDIRRKLLFMDQTSFVRLLSPEVNRFDLELEILDESWNFRGTGKDRTFDRPVKISHHPELRGRLGGDIIERAEAYFRSGNVAYAVRVLETLRDNLIPPENKEGKDMVEKIIKQISA
jgi:hypothetical protein